MTDQVLIVALGLVILATCALAPIFAPLARVIDDQGDGLESHLERERITRSCAAQIEAGLREDWAQIEAMVEELED